MKSIRSLMGRRQFLVAAGMSSASALIFNKFKRGFAAGPQANTATASEIHGTNDRKGAFSQKYHYLLSPIEIGNVVLKNRMIHTTSLPHFLQGPETFPSEQVISHYANMARNGAAVVSCSGGGNLKNRKEMSGDAAHNPMWDIEDPSVQNYFAQMTDAIHFYGSKASVGIMLSTPEGYTIGTLEKPIPRREMFSNPIAPGKEIPVELMQVMIDDAVRQATLYQSMGFDMVNFHMAYRAHMLAHALSPAINKRTDRYGGSAENRARFALEMFQAVKGACGKDFLVEATISGEDEPGGYSVQDMVRFVKTWEGTLDIIQLRGMDGDSSHPTRYNLKRKYPATLAYAEAIKKSGVNIVTAPVGGFQDLDLNEEHIAQGRADMIAMARAFICDPEYGEKAYEGRGEDVVPCLRCNDCHGLGMKGPWYSFCSVNPKLGMAHRIHRMIGDPAVSRKVAVIGGGPAGMKAAIVASARGHKVTLYEKNDFLGGQLRHTDFDPFKWPYKDYKDYLIRQMDKAGVEVHLKTRATPEMIKAKGYEAILLAIGADPIIPDIPGAKSRNVLAPIFVYGNKALGEKIVVIGGEQIGTETGIYLAQNGHRVTLITEAGKLATDANQIHFYGTLRTAWQALDNFSYITKATVSGISPDGVTYANADGDTKSIPADNVVIYAGRRPRKDEALGFYGAADRFFIIGDCLSQGNVRGSARTAFAAASQI